MADVLQQAKMFSALPLRKRNVISFNNVDHQKKNSYKPAVLPSSSSLKLRQNGFLGRRLSLKAKEPRIIIRSRPRPAATFAQMITGVLGQNQKWWEKGLQPNMREITGAQDLVDSLRDAGDTLVVVDFFSPGCGGCKALHPKLCQLAQQNPDVQFLQVNYEEHKSMCYALNVHVLPFFRFYRGAHGRLCSFSCTNATIKKFRDALAKHNTDRCSLAPTKGLEEKELVALAANKDLLFEYMPKHSNRQPEPAPKEEVVAVAAGPSSYDKFRDLPPLPLPLPLPLTTSSKAVQGLESEAETAASSSSRR